MRRPLRRGDEPSASTRSACPFSGLRRPMLTSTGLGIVRPTSASSGAALASPPVVLEHDGVVQERDLRLRHARSDEVALHLLGNGDHAVESAQHALVEGDQDPLLGASCRSIRAQCSRWARDGASACSSVMTSELASCGCTMSKRSSRTRARGARSVAGSYGPRARTS